jgi:DtxR family Mn-dependent transcriptional regulator
MVEQQGPNIGQLSESLEDYVEIIFNLIESQKVARVRDIARAKDVKMSSVVAALKRLDQEGLVRYEAREFVELTEPGSGLAKRLLKRHYFLTKFLVEVLQVDPITAEQDACQMEHAISLETMNRIYKFAEFLKDKGAPLEELVRQFREKAR